MACTPQDSRHGNAGSTLQLAAIFDSDQPYATEKLDSGAFGKFYMQHPEYRADSAATADFYKRREMQFAWVLGDSLSASAVTFLSLAAGADTTYHTGTVTEHSLEELLDESGSRERLRCDSCRQEVELLLTSAFFRFAERYYGGYLNRDPRDLHWFLPRARKEVTPLIDSLAAGSPNIAAYEPVHPQYLLLKGALRSYSELAQLEWEDIVLPTGRALREGDSAVAIAQIRERLSLLGDAAHTGSSQTFDSELTSAVQRFQMRHGLKEDGVIGPAVMRALNTDPADRIRSILVNMERLRWLPATAPDEFVLVNIPEFRLHVVLDGVDVMSMPVVVGRSATRTVVFADSISKVVFSPTWTVPASITRSEILPRLRSDADYLTRNNMEIVGGSATNPVLRQRPLGSNPMGAVKFLFPNSYSIYMHDTPATALFDTPQRTFSHGCIRLGEPLKLAVYLLRNDPAWPEGRIREAMRGGVETEVELQRKIPVVIGYFTTWVDRTGRINFREDVYGHDAQLWAELFAAPAHAGGD